MKGYWIALYKKIVILKMLKKLWEKSYHSCKNLWSKFLVRGGKFKTLEGEDYPRTVYGNFQVHDQAIKCHNSKEYQDGWALAKDTTDRNSYKL